MYLKNKRVVIAKRWEMWVDRDPMTDGWVFGEVAASSYTAVNFSQRRSDGGSEVIFRLGLIFKLWQN